MIDECKFQQLKEQYDQSKKRAVPNGGQALSD